MPLSLVAEDPASAFYARVLERAPGPSLVLGSGDGRVAFAIASKGVSVVAVEPSEPMHRSALELAAQLPGIPPRLLNADLRSLRLEERFKFVCAPLNALGMMSERHHLESALATVAQHLAPGGTFAFDLRSGERAPFSMHLSERKHDRSAIRRMRQTFFQVEDVDRALGSVGLQALERYGDFLMRPFEAADTLQVIVGTQTLS
jgi:SAM-dependent methyltransferase